MPEAVWPGGISEDASGDAPGRAQPSLSCPDVWEILCRWRAVGSPHEAGAREGGGGEQGEAHLSTMLKKVPG